jgi:arginine deiminase
MSAPRHTIQDEVSRLQACALFAPGDELDRMLPQHIESAVQDSDRLRENPDYLLFDDLVLLPLLRDEHAELASVVRAVTGPQACLDVRVMLGEVLGDESVAAEVVAAVVADDRLTHEQRKTATAALTQLRGARLAEALIQGALPHAEQAILPAPAPNLLFARDLWAPLGDAIVLGWPRHRARQRDGVLSRAIVRHHPQFTGVEAIDLREANMDADICLEGGDVLVAAQNLVLVGFGPRTSMRAAHVLAERLPANVDVLGVQLPLRRATMHLDTLLTFIDTRAVLAYLPAFDSQRPADERCEVTDLRSGQPLGCNLPAILGERLWGLQVVPCGDGDPVAAPREQWTDGANAVCLAPGRIVLYRRNTRTLRALNRAGFEVLTPQQFVANTELLLQGDRRIVVAVGGAELSRGRGGPRCLTLPVGRARVASAPT